ncbi:uncharacterized protein [Heptranchias perlo]|uniref:uncharacterized protein isoform X2 n=1 Tax=Heptranchias perlo TaxID=212740 RepID=UPI003559FB86
MQNTNVANDSRGGRGRAPIKTKSIGELVLPGGPVGQLTKVNQAKHKEQEGLKRTSVAVLKYNPGLAKVHHTDKRKSFFKRGRNKDVEESRLWTNVAGGTEVHFSGHAVRHLKPQSQSSPGVPGRKRMEPKSSAAKKSSATKTDQLMTTPKKKTSARQPLSKSTPQPWTLKNKTGRNSDSESGASTDVLNLL